MPKIVLQMEAVNRPYGKLSTFFIYEQPPPSTYLSSYTYLPGDECKSVSASTDDMYEVATRKQIP